MTNPAGSFIWYELMTTDVASAKAFYDAVVGWNIAGESASPAQDYRMIARADGGNAGGVLGLSREMCDGGASPVWLGYLYVPDVDGTVAAIEADGGSVQMPAADIPGIGRIAMLTDPQGVPFYVMNPTPPPGMEGASSDVFDPMAHQRVNWNELSTPDLAAGKAFYAKHFGFEFNEAMNMGEFGDYCFIDHGGQRIGAMMGKRHPSGPAKWLFYFGVPSIAAAQRAIEAGGGKVTMGPHEVPGPMWIVNATDPQGAEFALVGQRGE